MRSLRLGSKLILVILLASLVMIGGTLAYISINVYRSTEAGAYNEARAWAEATASQVSLELSTVQYATTELAHIVSLYQMFPKDRLGPLLDGMLKATLEGEGRLINTWVILEPGTILPDQEFRRAWHRMDGKVQAKDLAGEANPPAFEMAKRAMKSIIAEPYEINVANSGGMAMGAPELASSIVVPVMNENGTMVGVVGADFGLGRFQETLGKARFYKSGYGELLTNSGLIVTSGDSSLIGKIAHELMDDQAEAVRAAIAQGMSFGLVSKGDEHGQSSFKYLAPVNTGKGTSPWSYLVIIPVAEVLAGVNRLVLATAAIGALSLAVLIVVLLFGVSRLIRPLDLTVRVLKDISEGEGDLTRKIETRQRDEVGELAEYFNRFTGTLSTMISTIIGASRRLATTGGELSLTMEQVAHASSTIALNIRGLLKVSENQSRSIDASSLSINEILGRIEGLNDLIVNQAASVTESSASIEEMIANIQSVAANVEKSGQLYGNLVGAAEEGMNRIAEVTRMATEISRQSASLSEANEAISGISSTTNLLAMNAAIEAAHAGEAGKGFAVVADEIRNLAESANDQSRSIEANLKEIQASILAVVASSENAEQGFTEVRSLIVTLFGLQEEIKNAMSEQSAGSSQILEALGAINEVTSEVRVASGHMRKAGTAVAGEIDTLLAFTSELRHGVDSISVEAAEIESSVVRAKDLTNANSDNIEVLMGESAQFKI